MSRYEYSGRLETCLRQFRLSGLCHRFENIGFGKVILSPMAFDQAKIPAQFDCGNTGGASTGKHIEDNLLIGILGVGRK